MNWKQVQLIFQRETIDQLRDRRTVFTITVLPLLLYPLLGLLMMQVAQFNREYAVKLRIIGLENWPAEPALLDEQLNAIPRNELEELSRWLEIDSVPYPASDSTRLERLERDARGALQNDELDAVLIVKPDFASQLQRRLEASSDSNRAAPPNGESIEPRSDAEADDRPSKSSSDVEPTEIEVAGGAAREPDDESDSDGDVAPDPPNLELIVNLARDRSQVAKRRVATIIEQWQEAWVARQLASSGINPRLVDPPRIDESDIASQAVRRAMLWSKLLPFVMLVWALTGAFYPAIDLCAGEKERGTLETLLSSPARRQEIVWGKLMTVCVFSIGSALLNMFSMHVTAGVIVSQLAKSGTSQLAEVLGPMPIHAFGWLILLLLPMAAFFSALALAVAALARSTKEGQYYLMPLLLVTLPLVALPMIPSLELSLGTSLVPVSGAVFLVRSLIEGRYMEALVHLPAVIVVTVACCALAIRWAIRQFESESVMFRESDKWNVRLWLHHLWRDRGDTASPTEAVMCGVLILIAMFYAQFVAGSSIDSWYDIVRSMVAVQVGIILTPCLLMSLFLTRSIRHALRVHRTQPIHLLAAALLGITLHPTYQAVVQGISSLYELGPETTQVLAHFQAMVCAQPLWQVLLLMALLPAVCEELAFRGFIFGGLLRHQGALRAIVVSALFFGFTHTILQQSIAASLMGLVLGLIAWRTGGVICTIVVHALNNCLSLSQAWLSHHQVSVPAPLSWAIRVEEGSWMYQPAWITISVVFSAALFVIIFRRSKFTQQVVESEMA